MTTYDAAVIGGGLAGYAAAVGLAKQGLDVLHMAPPAPVDKRTSALMEPSVAILRDLGLVQTDDELGIPLSAIRIIDATTRLIRAPETNFDAKEAGLDAFGWNFSNAVLLEQFAKKAAALNNLTHHGAAMSSLQKHETGYLLTDGEGKTFTARLVVGADGKRSAVRSSTNIALKEHKFDQSALVVDLDLGRPVAGTSIEFHYENGPFTLVPAGEKRANLVWIHKQPVLDQARQLPKAELEALFRQKAHNLFGPVSFEGKCVVFPLSTLSVSKASQHGITLVGEAAHAFPPIGAQGLNLGLRDVADLITAIKQQAGLKGDDVWAERVGEDYARLRRTDLFRTGKMVDTLFNSLLSDFLPSQAMRAGGLWALRLVPALRRRAFALGMGERRV